MAGRATIQDAAGQDPTGISAATECAARLDLLSNPVRLAVVRALGLAPRTVSDLLDKIAIEQNLLSHHLKVLREGGLVVTERVSRSVRYSLAPGVSVEQARSINLGCCRVTFPTPGSEGR
ncbi:MAG: ArsR/SmtB family transcription factor [Parvularculaceae bacterium]